MKTTTKSAAELDHIAEQIVSSIKAVERTGVQVDTLQQGYCKLRMPLEGNVNHVNMMYAGSLFTVSELMGGALFLSAFDTAKYYPVVIEVNIQYAKPAVTDITTECELSEAEIARIQGELNARGKCVYILKQELKDTNGETVAVTRGVYQARAF